jgi:AcrR family transcriptional regulator
MASGRPNRGFEIVNIESRRRRIHNSFKAELQEVALELFAKRGFDAVSFGDIAFAAGISERLMHRYFREMDDILLKGFCENAPSFCKALMTMPRTMAPVDAFQLAMACETAPLISLERVYAILILSEKSPKLRALVNERRRLWENEVSITIAAWLGSSTETDFGPDFWASAFFNAFAFALRAEAGEAGLNAEFYDPAKVAELAFESLRQLTAPPARLPAGLTNAAGIAQSHLPGRNQRSTVEMAGE